MSQGHGQQGQGPQMMPSSPPYPPQVWMLGGRPTKSVDVPIMSVFLVLFIISAAAHMAIFQLNRKKGHKFLMSILLFGFSMARVLTSILRIASVSLPRDIPLAIAANVFTAAGVLILYLINLIFAERIIRSAHPSFGWHKAFSLAFKVLCVLIIPMIIMVITATVQSFYTLNTNIRRIDRDIQLAGITYFAVISFLPIPIVLLGIAIPRKHELDTFGQGRWRTKVRILLISSILICFGATYRAGTTWLKPVPMSQPLPAYFHKAAFYIVNFTVEIIVLFMYAELRIDRRFYVPDGAHGSYNVGSQMLPSAPPTAQGKDIDRQSSVMSLPAPSLRVYTEEETFDGETLDGNKRFSKDVEMGRTDSPDSPDSPRLDTKIESSKLDMSTAAEDQSRPETAVQEPEAAVHKEVKI